jgi:hypothetical protein
VALVLGISRNRTPIWQIRRIDTDQMKDQKVISANIRSISVIRVLFPVNAPIAGRMSGPSVTLHGLR